MPSVAVVIACFNHGRFLSEAIDSVLAQHRPVEEIIVVDDGSTDNTRAVTFLYDRVRYIWQENAGLSSARNTGLASISSTHVLFLDADDLLWPNALADAISCFEDLAHAAFVYGGYREIGPDRAVLDEKHPTQIDVYLELLKRNHITMHGAVLYRADVLRKDGGFDEKLQACEDYDVYLRLSRRYPIGMFCAIAADYRRHDSNMTNNAALMLKAISIVLGNEYRHVRRRPALVTAWREGMKFCRVWYGDKLFDQIVGEFRRPGGSSRAVRLLALSLRYDPRLAFRRARAVAGRLKRRLRPHKIVD